MTRLARRLVAAATAVLAAVALVGCTASPAPTATSTPVTVGVAAGLKPFYGQHLVWTSCGTDLQCTTAIAPLDWSAPGGARIHLALVRHLATGTRLGTFFMNPGGPGASGVDFIKGGVKGFFDDALIKSYDITAWDPRGVGHSTPVSCYSPKQLDSFLFSDPDTNDPAVLRADAVKQGVAFGKACAAKSGALLAHVGTDSTVQDLDMLRAATGSAKLNYFGFSYGTEIGTLYADRYPKLVGRMVLDGIEDPSVSAFGQNLANVKSFSAALEAYLKHCTQTTGCPFHGQTVADAVAETNQLLLDVRAHPLSDSSGLPVNSSVVSIGIDEALYYPELWTVLDRALTNLSQGDPSLIVQLAEQYWDRTASGTYSDNIAEAIYAVSCLDRPVATDPATIAAQGKQLAAEDPIAADHVADMIGDPVCGNWPVKPTSTPHRVHATGAPPIVLLGTTGDPATPYQWAQSVQKQLPHAVLLTLVGQGHTAYRDGNTCINTPVDRFFTTGTLPAAGIRCG